MQLRKWGHFFGHVVVQILLNKQKSKFIYAKRKLQNVKSWDYKVIPENIYLFKVNKTNTRKRREIFWTYFTPFSSISFADFEKVNIGWDGKVLLRKKSGN